MKDLHSTVALKKPPIQPRGLSRIDAARYVGISPTTFDGMVRDGRMPPPKRINSRTVWDIRQLDDAFEALPSDGYEDHDPFESVTL
jgi:predicted DNA-binding transcriptional regulator AlpA